MVLYNRTEGGSSGAIYKLLQSTGLIRTAFHATRQCIATGWLTEDEFESLMTTFKQSLPNADPSAINRTRSVRFDALDSLARHAATPTRL